MWEVDIPIRDILNKNVSLFQISSKDHIRALSHDSRNIHSDVWFISLKGKDHDGHDFISECIQKGVKRFIYDPSCTDMRPSGLHVKDTNLFLQEIALWWRKKLNTPIIGITGTNGKTSTKELTYFMLRNLFKLQGDQKEKIIKSESSFNNQYGLPFTLLKLRSDSIFGVVEMGMNHRGEIGLLSQLALPDHAMITTIQEGHIGYLKSLKEIAEEKYDIIKGLKKKGHLYLHFDITHSEIIKERSSASEFEIHWLDPEKSNIILKKRDIQGTYFIFKDKTYFLPIPGDHYFRNFQLIFLFIEFLQSRNKIPSENIEYSLSKLKEFKNISGRLTLLDYDKYSIWDDSYNANPASFEASIKTLTRHISSARLFGAFGYMAELGHHTKRAHIELAEVASKYFNTLAFFSPDPDIYDVFKKSWIKHKGNDTLFVGGVEKKDILEGAEFLNSKMRYGDSILVKGSRSTKMERIIHHLK